MIHESVGSAQDQYVRALRHAAGQTSSRATEHRAVLLSSGFD
jgi:hypothetical protein